MKTITTFFLIFFLSTNSFSQGWRLDVSKGTTQTVLSNGVNSTFNFETNKEINIAVSSSAAQSYKFTLTLDNRPLSDYGFNAPSNQCYVSYNMTGSGTNTLNLQKTNSLQSQQVNAAVPMGNDVYINGFPSVGTFVELKFYVTRGFNNCFVDPFSPSFDYPLPNNNAEHTLRINFIDQTTVSNNGSYAHNSPFELCTPIIDGPNILPCQYTSTASNLSEFYSERYYKVNDFLPPTTNQNYNCNIAQYYVFNLDEHVAGTEASYVPSTKYSMVFDENNNAAVYVFDQEPAIEKAAVLKINGVIQNPPYSTWLTKEGKKTIVSECFLPTNNNGNTPSIENLPIHNIAVTSTEIRIVDLMNYDLNIIKNPTLEVTTKNPLDFDKFVFDWFIHYADGTEKQVDKGTAITALVPGIYFAKAKLRGTVRYNASTEDYEIVEEPSPYYVGVSENVIVYNSTDDTPTILNLYCYPNPATDKVSVNYEYTGKVEKAVLEIYSQIGNQQKLVKDFQVKNQIDNIDLSDLQAGNYIVVLRLNDTIWQSTVLVKQ